nr:DUF6611 family protein [Mycolicibacterium baixiangningiae]
MITSVSVVPPVISLFVSAAVFLGTGVAALLLVGDARRRVRTAIASVTVGFYHPAAHQEARHLQRLAQRLAAADIERREGTLTPVAYEATWWEVYNDLTADDADAPVQK